MSYTDLHLLNNELNAPFTMLELRSFLRKVKGNKAPGNERIP